MLTLSTKCAFRPNGTALRSTTGRSFMKMIFGQPPIQLHLKSVEDELSLPGGAQELAVRRRIAAESVAKINGQGDFNAATSSSHRWKVSAPGFVYACNGTTIDECFGRMIFGLAKDQVSVI